MALTSAPVGGVEVLTLDFPPLNTLGLEEVTTLRRHFETCDQGMPLVITAVGKAFSAGVDTRKVAAYTVDERVALAGEITAMTSALIALKMPVVAAVNGHAIGGGLVMALACDYRLVADTAGRFGLTEARAGVPFPAGPLAIIRHELSPPTLRRLSLTGTTVTAEEMLREGAFDELVAADSLLALACERAADMAGQPAFAEVKQQLRGELARRMQALPNREPGLLAQPHVPEDPKGS